MSGGVNLRIKGRCFPEEAEATVRFWWRDCGELGPSAPLEESHAMHRTIFTREPRYVRTNTHMSMLVHESLAPRRIPHSQSTHP